MKRSGGRKRKASDETRSKRSSKSVSPRGRMQGSCDSVGDTTSVKEHIELRGRDERGLQVREARISVKGCQNVGGGTKGGDARAEGRGGIKRTRKESRTVKGTGATGRYVGRRRRETRRSNGRRRMARREMASRWSRARRRRRERGEALEASEKLIGSEACATRMLTSSWEELGGRSESGDAEKASINAVLAKTAAAARSRRVAHGGGAVTETGSSGRQVGPECVTSSTAAASRAAVGDRRRAEPSGRQGKGQDTWQNRI